MDAASCSISGRRIYIYTYIMDWFNCKYIYVMYIHIVQQHQKIKSMQKVGRNYNRSRTCLAFSLLKLYLF